MKTKLSFLALPSICLGIALTFAISACTSDSSNPEPTPGGTSSSSTGGGGLSSKVESGSIEGTFTLEEGLATDKVLVSGKYTRKGNVEIRRMEITPYGWVTYDGKLVTGPVSFPAGNDGVNFGNDTYIDLTNPDIKCGSNDLTIKVCIDDCTTSGKWVGETKKFNKPTKYCASSSSQGAGQSSSSEADKWKFGNPSDLEINKLGEPVSISGTSISFVLSGDGGMPDIEVMGGATVRYVQALGDDDDDVVPGKFYDAYNPKNGDETLGDKIPTKSKDETGVTKDTWFMIYYNADRYLLHFQCGGGASGVGCWSKWPKKCTYWLALSKPK